jgi:type VI secretion system protein ImpL
MTLYIIIGVVVVALIVLVTIYFLQKRKAKKAAEAMGDQGAAPGGDDISVLIHEAEAKLSAAKLENAKVGNLPVYLIVGDPGTTKTSVVLHSGLEPELIAGQVYQAGNVAPTRTANFWFSRRSLFVETGGTLSGDLGRWRTAVKKLQPKSSVRKGEQAGRAAVVCFDCENFTRQGAADIVTNSARNLRARLGEISQAMGINLPVYALFTKIDRLPFFTEFVRNLNGDEHTQVLGVTLPMLYRRSEGVYAEEETARLTGSFERLFRSVADARPEFLAREGDASKLPPAYEFPREFRKIRPAVVQFLVDLCRPSQLTVGPFLRGFYFTGVRPVIMNESAPVAPAEAPQTSSGGFPGPAGATAIFNPRMLQAQAPGPVQPAAPPQVTGARKVPQWLFLSHLFNDILLADKVAMGASGSSIKTSTARRFLLTAAASLCFLLALIFTISFFKNNSLENRVRDAARGISATESAGAELASLPSLQKLENLRQSLETLVGYRRDGAPWAYRFGLYIGDDLYKVARPIYCNRFRKLLLTQTQANILQDMRGLPATTAPEQHPYQPTYDELKAYLITTTHPDKSTRLFLTPVLMRWWTNRHEVDSERLQLAQKQFDFYADDLKQDGPCASEGDSLAVDRTRKYLKLFGGFEQVYGYMLAEADKHGSPVNFNRQYPGSDRFVLGNYDVRAAFSKGGWTFMNDNFGRADQFFGGEQWVLGDQGGPSVDRARLAADLKTRYYGDFIREWTNYVKSARVLGYSSLADAAQKLKAHSSNLAPLLEFSSLASRNTAVPDPSQSGPFQPVQSVTPPDKTDTYVGPSNGSYITALVTLQASIETLASQPPNDAAAGQTLQIAGQARGTVSQMSNAFRVDSPIQQTLQALLLEPITQAERLLKGVGASELNAKGAGLCKQINPVLAKYPFNAGSQNQATIPDIDLVFKPKDGAIWQFVDGNLVGKLVTKQGPQYAPMSGGGTVTLQPAFLAWINRAAAFTDAAFKDGSADPHFNYTIKPELASDMEKVTMVIHGQTAVFTSASNTAKPLVWPGPGPHGVSLTVQFQGGFQAVYPSFDGLWAIFQFVLGANRRNGNVIDWDATAGSPPRPIRNPANNQPVIVKFDIGANPPIFDRGYFSLTCVPGVAR